MESYNPSVNREPLREPRSRLPLLLLLLAFVAALWFLPFYLQQVEYRRTQGRVNAIAEGLGMQDLSAVSQASGLMAEKVGPSVVQINTARSGGFAAYEAQGEGSGVIVDTEGFIVTNNHVVEGATTINVTLYDGRSFRATTLGRDPQVDLAVLKIEAPGLIAAKWGDSESIKVGEFVWALGSPFGLVRTVTFGILSATERTEVSNNPEQKFLQTDAAVNPGNSGGPLVNIYGDVIGINTAIIGPRFSGVGFAIPSNTARARYEELKDHEPGATIAGYGFIGIGVEPVTEGWMARLSLPDQSGALVNRVLRGSPAEMAGIQPADVIVSWGGDEIKEAGELPLKVANTPIGTEVEVVLIRDGEQVTVRVTVGDSTQSPISLPSRG